MLCLFPAVLTVLAVMAACGTDGADIPAKWDGSYKVFPGPEGISWAYSPESIRLVPEGKTKEPEIRAFLRVVAEYPPVTEFREVLIRPETKKYRLLVAEAYDDAGVLRDL
jgi:CO/xanthine dehydrogenase Mo-binding subunit